MEFARKQNENPKNTFKLGVTEFSDITLSEFSFSSFYTSIPNKYERRLNLKIVKKEKEDFVDWRVLNNTKVYYQGECGSCYALSTIDSIESYMKIKNNTTQELSRQEIVDCSNSYYNKGCDGGRADYTLNYVMDSGICADSTYKYSASEEECDTENCGEKITVPILDYSYISGEEELERVVKKHPVVIGKFEVEIIGIQGMNRLIQLYTSGVINNGDLCEGSINHAVLLMGYNRDENNNSYWIIKNTWGENWGENGYIYS